MRARGRARYLKRVHMIKGGALIRLLLRRIRKATLDFRNWRMRT